MREQDLFDYVGHEFDSSDIMSMAASLCAKLAELPRDAHIDAQNEIKRMMHAVSPMKSEPVDCVIWVPRDNVKANDYNPNSVAPPEMELLKVSIESDGYTQPIVTMPDEDIFEVVDGFHRHRVGKEIPSIAERVSGRLPIVAIKDDRRDKGDRMAATIRHNRARGKHKIEAMSDIVLDLKKRNWSDDKIAKELGMDSDEVLRLAQITGLAEMFKDEDFSQAWEADIDDMELVAE